MLENILVSPSFVGVYFAIFTALVFFIFRDQIILILKDRRLRRELILLITNAQNISESIIFDSLYISKALSDGVLTPDELLEIVKRLEKYAKDLKTLIDG